MNRVIVAGLAATRLVRAWHYETIGERPRELVMAWLDKPVMRRTQTVAGMSRATDEINVRASAVKEWVAELLDCPHCLGFWLTLGSTVAYRNRRLRPVVEALAGAMILSIIVQWYPGFDFDESFPAVRIRVMGDETAEHAEP